MQNQLTENDILTKLSEVTLRDVKDIHMDMHLADELGIDSLGIANLIAKFEAVITAHPSMDQFVTLLSNAQTVGEFSNLIINRKEKS